MSSRIAQAAVEVLIEMEGAYARVTQQALEVLFPYTAPSPTTVTGAGVAQRAVEVLFAIPLDDANLKVTQDVIEVLMCIDDAAQPAGGPVTTGWGYVS